MMTVTFDFPNHRYSGVALGELFDKQLELVSETGNVVVFTSDTTTIVAQLQSDGSVMLTKQGADGGIPQIFTRSVRQ